MKRWELCAQNGGFPDRWRCVTRIAPRIELLLGCAEPARAAATADAEAAAVGLNEPAERGQMRQFGRAQITICERGFSHAVGYWRRGKCVDRGAPGL